MLYLCRNLANNRTDSACKVGSVHGPYTNFRVVNPTNQTRHTKRCNTTMNANTRDFETELQAQAEEDRREEPEVSAKANLVTATAL